MLSKQVSITELQEEIAFHEASHFVIGLLITKEFLIFHSPDYIVMNVKEGEKLYALVYGSTPKDIDKKNNLSKIEIREKIFEFHSQNNERVYLYCLKLMAGYNSYKIFIENREDYFGLPDLKYLLKVENKNIVKYYSLTEAHTQVDRFNKMIVGDIKSCHSRLFGLGIFDKESKDEYLNEVISDLDKLMKNKDVQEAIIFTKEKLLISNGQKIEGEDLNELINEVSGMLDEVLVSDIVDKLKYNRVE